MAINISSNFTLSAQLPLDSRSVVADVTARNAIPAIQRYQGMLVFLTSTSEIYQLQGGILDVNWVLVSPGVNYLPADVGVAQDIYVATTGNDSNNGDTALTPYLTLNRARQRISGSSIGGYWRVNIADGTYAETLIVPEFVGGRGSASMGNSMVEWIGNETTPGNVVISNGSTIVTMFNCDTAHLFAGIEFVGTGSNIGIFSTRSVFFIRNCSFTDCGVAVLATGQSHGQWLASTAGSTITNPDIAFQSNNSSFFIISEGLTLTGVTTHCFQVSNNAVLGFTGSITTDATADAGGATAYVQASNGGLINMSSNATHNVDGFDEPIRVIVGGQFQDNPDGTWNLNDCGVVARVTENSRFTSALSGTTTYNNTGTTPDEVQKGDLAYIYSTFIPTTWYTYQQDTNANFGCDFRYRITAESRHLGALPVGVTRFFAGDQLVTNALPMLICDRPAAYIDELRVVSRVGNGAAHTDTYTVMVNGVASTITGAITNGTSLTVTNAIAALVAGDLVTVQVETDAATAAEDVFVQIKMRYT